MRHAFQFPMFSLMWKPSSRALLLQGRVYNPTGGEPQESGLLLPLFTSEENADLYRERNGGPVMTVEFPEARNLLHYCRNPPGWGNADEINFVIDPISPDAREFPTIQREPVMKYLTELASQA